MVKDDAIGDHHDVVELHKGLRRGLEQRDEASGLERVCQLIR